LTLKQFKMRNWATGTS